MFPATIPDLLDHAAARAGQAPWLFFEDESWTLPDVLGEVDRTAVGLSERFVVAGDRVAILVGNAPATLFSWFAANRLGAIAAPLNTAYKSPELAGVLRLVRPRVLVVAEAFRPLAKAAVDSLPDDARPALVAPEALTTAGSDAPRANVSTDDVCVLLATSGTTGAPKAVMQTHRTFVLTAEAFPAWVGATAADRFGVALPLFHINAQAYSTMGALGIGASLAILPRFSASRFWENARRHHVTQMNTVGAMVHILGKTPPSAEDRHHEVRRIYTALALPEALHRGFEERFGVSMTVGYGLSETTFGTVWPREGAPPFGTMGVLRQHPTLGEINRARVVRDDGLEAEADETGELWLSNPATMRGYWEDPQATQAALDGGWLRTGDLVKRSSSGVFTFVARKKEVLRRRGENVAAAEIEGALLAHPGVREAAVIGVASELGEDEIVAYVSPSQNAVLDPEELRAFVATRLADFKVPSKVVILAELPKTATERVAKHLLPRTPG